MTIHEWLNPEQTRPLCSCGWHGPKRYSSVAAGTEWTMHRNAAETPLSIEPIPLDCSGAFEHGYRTGYAAATRDIEANKESTP